MRRTAKRSIAAVLVRTVARLRGSASTALRRGITTGCVARARIERLFYSDRSRPRDLPTGQPNRAERCQRPTQSSTATPTSRSSHGASPVEDMVERAAELGLSGARRHRSRRAVRRGPLRHAPPRPRASARSSGSRSSCMDAAAPDPERRSSCRRGVGAWARAGASSDGASTTGGVERGGRGRAGAATTRAARGCRAIGSVVKEDLRGIGERQRGPASRAARARRDGLPEPVPARLPREPRRDQARAAVHARSSSPSTPRACVALSGGREGEIARRLRVGDREGARVAAERYAALFGRAATRATGDGRLLHRAVAPPAARRRLARRRARGPRRRARPAGRRRRTTSTTPGPRTASCTTS